MTKVYVGNLASSVTSDELADLFSRAGEVRGALVISDKTTGLCRGFGFVEMTDAEDARTAIEMLNCAELKGQRIEIDPHPPRESGSANVYKGGESRRRSATAKSALAHKSGSWVKC